MKRVDARGLSCPEPVIQTKNAMASKEAEYEVPFYGHGPQCGYGYL